MKIITTTNYLLVLASSLLIFNSSCKDDDKTLPSCTGIEYEYSGADGPDHWKDLCIDYITCGGASQSPVNITGITEDATLTNIPQTYSASETHIVNKGHTIQFNYDAGSSITVNGLTYNLLQFHTHTPSEHNVTGVSYPLELHFVHKNDATGNLAVMGVFVKEGLENPVLANFIDHLPTVKDSTYNVATTFNATNLFPADKDYYTYSGSLTTPPCSEIVTWIVMEHPIEASLQQIEAFEAIEHHNNRPVQALNGRVIKHHLD